MVEISISLSLFAKIERKTTPSVIASVTTEGMPYLRDWQSQYLKSLPTPLLEKPRVSG
jgi:hypothetical protein